MKNILCTLLLASLAIQARQAAVFSPNGTPDPRITDALERAHYKVSVWRHDDILDAAKMASVDLYVVPDATNYPFDAYQSLNTFVESRKDLLLLGPQPFSQPMFQFRGEWLSEDGINQRLLNIPAMKVVLPERAAWTRNCRDNTLGTTLDLHDGLFVFDCPKYYGWDGFSAAMGFPPQTNLLRFSARGNANTRSLSIECIEKDGSRWIAAFPLSLEWQDYILTPSDFKFWHDCHPSKPRGQAGDILALDQTAAVKIGLSDTHTPGIGGTNAHFEIRNFAATHFTEVLPAFDPAQGLQPLETIYPSYKQYPNLHKPGYYYTPSRFCGRGIGMKPYWRWFPFKLDNGQLVADDTLRSEPYLWMTLYLDGKQAGTRIATIAAAVNTQDDNYVKAIELLARRLNQRVELVAGGTDAFGLFPDQPLKAGAELLFLDASVKREDVTVDITVNGQSFTLKALDGECQSRSVKDLQPETMFTASAVLKLQGQILDIVSHPVNVTPTRETLRSRDNERITVKGDNFMLNGKPWYPVGVNLWFSNACGVNWKQYIRGTWAPGIYDPLQAEKDLETLERLGFNMVSIQLLGDTNAEDTYHNMLDFFVRCRRHNIYANGFERHASPLDFKPDEFRTAVRDSDLYLFPTLFAYDICWEPGNYMFDYRSRGAYDVQWRAWIDDQYGSLANAVKEWGVEPNYNDKKQLLSPTDYQLSHDGDWRIYVAAYRRFMDDLSSAMWGRAIRSIRQISPLQLISFRQGNTVPCDFALTGPVKHLDFICPEGYSIPNSDDGYNAAGFITRLVNFTTNGKPVIWAEFGKSAWDNRRMCTNMETYPMITGYHELFYKMAVEAGANGTAPWWWSGGYRVGERSDFGITEPSGEPRPAANLLLKYAPLLKTPRTFPKGDVVYNYDRDINAGGYWYQAFNIGRDAYREARARNRHLVFSTPALGKDSSNVPLVAIGNVPANGHNPVKYLNGELNGVQLKVNGQWQALEAVPRLPQGTPVIIKLNLGNLTEVTWLAPQDASTPAMGTVVILKDNQPVGGIVKNAKRFEDVDTTEINLGPATGEPQEFVLRLASYQRIAFGQSIRVKIN